jgi:hypothetical protein
MTAAVADQTLMARAVHHADDVVAAPHLPHRHRVEGAVLGPQRGGGVAPAAVDRRAVLRDQLHDLDLVLERADLACQPLHGRSQLFDVGHLPASWFTAPR